MIHIHTSQQPAQEAAAALNALLDAYKDRDVLLLLSGGSALSLLDTVDATLLSRQDVVCVLDERYTSEPADSNTTQLVQSAFWERASKQHVSIIDPRPDENESLEDAARRFNLVLKEWHVLHHEGVVIATMGIGPDGHTSGVLPMPHNPDTFEELFFNHERCVRGYSVDVRVNPHTKRLTTTLSYIKKHVHHAVVYAAGDNKQEALKALVARTGKLEATPARILHALTDVHLYTDQEVLVN